MAQKDRTASLLVIAAGICWGIIGVFSKRLSAAGFSPVQITFGRSLVTAVVLTVMLAVKHPEKLRISWRDGWMFLGTGLCSIVFFNICYFIAIELTSLSVAAILLYTAPSIVMVLSVLLFKERFTVRKALALALAFGGSVLVSGFGSGPVTAAGILAGMGAGFGYALYSIFGRYALATYDTFTVTAWTFLVASLGLLGFCRPLEMFSIGMSSPKSFVTVLLLGMISTALPFLLYTEGLRRMESGKASILASMEPLTATVAGIFLFHEKMTAAGAGGIGLILAAVLLLNSKSRKEKGPIREEQARRRTA
ncbi:DMT family transporter [Lacrimispora sp. 210928-DFI.3.58]|uniref:DMT family transporter n=1 Tax=Lacrimispora sp. 210928-DFI.3.58 TaxID=2883214 RepID=UPI0015B5ADA7|nr:EamA family transporter [Lacrimispora sp. 210928-DFI.3.58]MCB7317327.1 DMT family transporter [Lacrimispora sp. 210928-DFI.3.58]